MGVGATVGVVSRPLFEKRKGGGRCAIVPAHWRQLKLLQPPSTQRKELLDEIRERWTLNTRHQLRHLYLLDKPGPYLKENMYCLKKKQK